MTVGSGSVGGGSVSDEATGAAAADYPAVGDVQDGVAFDGGAQTGTLVVPTEAQVQTGVGFGAGGTEFTGSLSAGTGVLEQGADSFQSIGAVTASSTGTLLTTGGSNTKGAYVELTASSPFKTSAVIISVSDYQTLNQRHLVDIAVGASGSEVVIIPNLWFASTNVDSSATTGIVSVPIEIPAGTRISARTQSEDAAGSCQIIVNLIGEVGGAATPSTSINAYGPNTATTQLPDRDFGNAGSEVANTKSAWTEITSSTSVEHTAVNIVLGYFTNVTSTSSSFLIDIGIGAAGAETVLVSNLQLIASFNTDRGFLYTGALPITIPMGSRLTFRAQVNSILTGLIICEVGVYGL